MFGKCVAICKLTLILCSTFPSVCVNNQVCSQLTRCYVKTDIRYSGWRRIISGLGQNNIPELPTLIVTGSQPLLLPFHIQQYQPTITTSTPSLNFISPDNICTRVLVSALFISVLPQPLHSVWISLTFQQFKTSQQSHVSRQVLLNLYITV